MEALGIEVKLLIGQIVNFLVLFAILGFFLYKPILKMLEDRRSKIAESLENAKKIEEKLASAETKSKEILNTTHLEAKKIIEEAKNIATEQKNEIISSAKLQADKVIESAKNEADSLKDKVISEAKKEISDVVLLALDKIVKQELSNEDKKKLTERALKEL